MKKLKRHLIITLCAFAVMAMFAGCSNESSGFLIAPEEPPINIKKVAGLLLCCNGKPVIFVDSANVTGTACATMNQNSVIFEVEFLDENGEVINECYQQHKLVWDCDEQYAKFESACDWGFCIFGKKTGKTAFQLRLECGRCVAYSSPAIPLEIK